jgi:hypothetical protein
VDQAEFSFLIDPAGPARAPFPAQLNRATPSPSLSLSSGARASGYLSSPTPAWPPEPTLRRRTHRNRAREEGAAGPPSRHARRAGARTRGPPQGEIYGGKDPCAPAGDALGTVAATEGRPRLRARASSQSWSAGASMPSHRFDRASTSPGTGPSLRQPTRIGVLPLSSVCAAKRREEGESGRSGGGAGVGRASRRRRRVAAGDRRGREEPDEGEAVRDSGGAGPERGATVNTDAAPPSTSSLR